MATARAFPEPENVGPRTFRVLGPFPAGTSGVDRLKHGGLANDYLSALGGEANAHIRGDTAVSWEGRSITAHDAALDARSAIDLGKLFGGDTDDKVAYAYAEWNVDKPSRVLALFGSDDGGAIWLNGSEVHRVAVGRALNPDSDRLDLALVAGPNRLLIKIDNGFQAWGFAFRMYDDEGRRRLQLLDVRRHLDRLEPRPASGDYFLEQALPSLAWVDPPTAALVFGKNPLTVRWFGPDLKPAESASREGQYTALAETTTLDGYPYRLMLTFAKVPRWAVPSSAPTPAAAAAIALGRWTARVGAAADDAEEDGGAPRRARSNRTD
ncbi:MAG TPA: hypothetical protein VGL13_01225, partial [Polyangiaceae bacterium]